MIDLDDNRLKLAKELGATHTINSGTTNAEEAVKEIVGGDGVDVAIEAVGIPSTWDICQKIVKPGAHIANVGVHGVKVDFDIQKLWIKNLTITTGLVNTNTTPMLLKVVSANRMDLKKMITHRFPLSELEHAYQVFLNAAEEKALKIIITNE
jgi:alcohol dehydrogenase